MGNELQPPPAAIDVKGIELLRLWAAEGAQHVSIATNVWKDPAAWGIALADLMKHIARSYEAQGDQTYEAALHRIRQGFDAEWANPTD
ncbi:DUF5076 domain-containing protein [Cupriavidus sp. 8B]